MATENSIIRNYAKTGIVLDELIIPNRSGNTSSPDPFLIDTDDRTTGYNKPLVYLNGYYIQNFLTYFELDLNQILPTLRFSFYTGGSTFLTVSYPKDGDIVSLYIRSNVSVYKPIRMDFNILSVNSGLSRDSTGEFIEFDVLCESRIPRFYTEICKAYRDKTSYETLFEVSQDLDLGFSTNDPTLNDRMTWICPNLSPYNFIKEVTKSCYKDERSFYMTFVDQYYNLTFVNINNQLDAEDIIQEVLVQAGSGSGKANDMVVTGIELKEIKVPLQISNSTFYADYPFYAQRFTLLSESGNSSNLMGYVQRVQFYDEDSSSEIPPEKYISYDVESVTTEKIIDNMVLQKGRPSEKLYKGEIRKRWMGILNSGQSGAVHENFFQANVQNPLNFSDVTKFTLQVETFSYYPGFYRGQVIPVFIYTKTKGVKMKNTGSSPNQEPQKELLQALDQFLSGQYVIIGYSVNWSPEKGFYQILNLCKREWMLNSSGTLPKAFPINFFSGTVKNQINRGRNNLNR